MQFFVLLAFIAASVFAACPPEAKIRAARVLVGNIINGINQRELGLLANAIASKDATAQALARIDGCCKTIDSTFAFMALGAILNKEKFVSVNITDSYNTAVGYTVVNAVAKTCKHKYSHHEFQFMDPNDNCALQLIYWNPKEECCIDKKETNKDAKEQTVQKEHL